MAATHGAAATAVALGAVIAALMLAPRVPDAPFAHADKLAHFLMFGALGLALGLRASGRVWRRDGLALLVVAIALELLQGAATARGFELFDALANAGGAAVGFGLGRLLSDRVRRRRPIPQAAAG